MVGGAVIWTHSQNILLLEKQAMDTRHWRLKIGLMQSTTGIAMMTAREYQLTLWFCLTSIGRFIPPFLLAHLSKCQPKI